MNLPNKQKKILVRWLDIYDHRFGNIEKWAIPESYKVIKDNYMG